MFRIFAIDLETSENQECKYNAKARNLQVPLALLGHSLQGWADLGLLRPRTAICICSAHLITNHRIPRVGRDP